MRTTLLTTSVILLGCASALAQLAPVQMGRASNAFTILRPEQNQVLADQNSNSVAFIHRQDVTVWGGGTAANGRLRYDLSIDGGASFTNDIGVLNNNYTQPARYPQMINFGNNANPFNNSFIWTAPNINPAGGWDGFVNGLSTVTTGAPFSTELYNEIGNNSLLQGGLCEGLSGEFWQVEFKSNGGSTSDTLRILKGSYVPVSGNVVWSIYDNVFLPHNMPFGGINAIGPNMMFSPSGQDGWVGYLGDLVGGADTTLNPIFIHSSDGGASWGAPMEVDLSTVSFEGGGNTLVEEIQALWEDSPGVPTSSGKPTCTFEYDITVDANGNPHMFVVVGSASTTGSPTAGYTVFTGLAKLAVDVFSEDGGATWKAVKVSPIYAFRDQWGTPDPNTGSLITMDNVPQVSRTQDGSKIFYSWVDSDTTVTGYGNNVNSEPNLRIAGRRISDGFMTCPKWITLGDATWDGEMLFPTMAPDVLTASGGTSYKLPIVSLDMLIDDQNAPCQFWYWGNEATLDDTDFLTPASNLITDNCSLIVGPPSNDDVCNALLLNLGVNGPFDVTNATAEVGEATPPIGSDPGIDPGCQSQDGWCSIGGEPFIDNSSWYTFVAPPSGNVTISSDGSTFDTQVAVWWANSCADLLSGTGIFVGGNDDNPNFVISQYSSEVTVTCLTPGATYYVQVDGYQGSEGDLQITLTDNNYVADPTINATSSVICDGSPVALTAPSGAGFSYLWSTGSSNQSIAIINGGSYSVTVTDTNGCSLSDTLVIMASTTPMAGFTYSATGATVSFTDATTGTIDSQVYLFGDGNTSNSNNPTHVYGGPGVYSVCMIVTNNLCGSDTVCQSVPVVITDLAEQSLGAVKVYPNPSEGLITLELTGWEGRTELSILDMAGRTVHAESLMVNAAFRKNFDLNLATGSYTLHLRNSEGVITRKLQMR